MPPTILFTHTHTAHTRTHTYTLPAPNHHTHKNSPADTHTHTQELTEHTLTHTSTPYLPRARCNLQSPPTRGPLAQTVEGAAAEDVEVGRELAVGLVLGGAARGAGAAVAPSRQLRVGEDDGVRGSPVQ